MGLYRSLHSQYVPNYYVRRLTGTTPAPPPSAAPVFRGGKDLSVDVSDGVDGPLRWLLALKSFCNSKRSQDSFELSNSDLTEVRQQAHHIVDYCILPPPRRGYL